MREIVLQLLSKQVEVSIKDVAHALKIKNLNDSDRKAIQRTLLAMVKDGILEPHGSTRDRSYTLSSTRRYQAGFLKSYEPNETNYFSSDEIKVLEKLGRSEPIQRPAGTYARNILNRLLIDLSWNSSRLEGNTYSLLETKRLIEFGESAEGKDASEAQMILNHKSAIEYLVETSEEKFVSAHTIYSIHAMLSDNLLGNPRASGRIRDIAVAIGGSSYIPLDNPHLLKEYFDVFIKKFNQIRNPFEQSLFALVHLSYLQAFEDVNKRTARLAANIPLIRHNLKPLSFIDVPKENYTKALLSVYESNNIFPIKDLFLKAYKRSAEQYSGAQKILGEPDRLKIKYRDEIKNIVRTVVLEKSRGSKLVPHIKQLISQLQVSDVDSLALFQIIEQEIDALHEGNIARFKLRPSEFQAWQK